MHKIIEGLVPLAVDITAVRNMDGNPRLGDVEAVARSLERFGQRKPVVVRADTREIVAGNHTYNAALSLGWTEIAVVYVSDDDVTAKAYSLADNRTSELGAYDVSLLAAMIQEVVDEDSSLLGVMSYTSDDLDSMLAEIAAEDPTDTSESTGARPATLTLNDRFMIGPFSVLNSREKVWQERKKMWISLGIESELGRDGKPLTWNVSSPPGHSHGAVPLVAEISDRG